MNDAFALPFSQIGVMVLLALAGFVMKKRGLLPESAPKSLSQVLVNAFMPALIIDNLSSNITLAVIQTKWRIVLYSILLLAASIVSSRLAAKAMTKDISLRPMIAYYLAFPNFSYIGYPLVTALFGSAVLSDYILFSMAFSVCVYTYGRRMITNVRVPVSRALFSPTVLAIASGLALGLLGIEIPGFVSSALTSAARCVSPVSMLLIGYILASCNIRIAFNRLVATVVLMRLVAIPVTVVGLAYLLGLRGEMLAILALFLAMPLPLNPIIFQESDGENSHITACVCCVSYLFALVTLPVMLYIVMALF
ncbi:MAG: AEC family transporter [Clostridia bacterium]|nr:AEC family transporter [Clostridia bacterium]